MQIQCTTRIWLSHRRVRERRLGLVLLFHTHTMVAMALIAMMWSMHLFATHRVVTRLAATAIQASWRGYAGRKHFFGGWAAGVIQRRWRYAAARTRARRLRSERDQWEAKRYLPSPTAIPTDIPTAILQPGAFYDPLL